MVAFVIPWLVLSRTGSALNAGGVAFATGIASVPGTLFGGVIVDHIGGRRHVRGRHGPDRRPGARRRARGLPLHRRRALLGPLTFLLVAWVAMYVPLSTLIFPAWSNFARAGAGALGVFPGAQALGATLGGLVFATVGPQGLEVLVVVPTDVAATAGLAALLATEPGSVAAVALSPCRSRPG